ncbi:MAG: hypothetical protein F4X02_02990 [Chloroflexi bacterium]|nr:hypothetical protein [Chloroflexota bacterium]
MITSKLSTKFSDVVNPYGGHGTINGDQTDFEIGQRSDGSIVLCCDRRLNWSDNCLVAGVTCDRQKIHAQGFVKTVMGAYSDYAFKREHRDYFYRSVYEFGLSVGESDWSRVHTLVFDITNLVFLGNSNSSGGFWPFGDTLKVELEGIELTFKKLPDYEMVVDRLNDEGGTATTCQLEIEIGSHNEHDVTRVVRNACSLLSLARGIQINWITCRHFDDAGNNFFTLHRSTVTSSFQDFEVIESTHLDATERFLIDTYPTFSAQNTQYKYSQFAHVLVDIQSAGFLETRCLALYTAVETLSRKVNNRKSINGKRVTLKKRLYDFMVHHQVPVFVCSNGKCLDKSAKCMENCDIGFYVKCRNKLVHQSEFYSGNPKNEYKRNINLFHKMLLRALNYNYKYINWHDGWNMKGQSSEDLSKGPFMLSNPQTF